MTDARINYWFKDTVNVTLFHNTVYVHISKKGKSGDVKSISLTAPAFRSLMSKGEEILHLVEDYEMVAATEASDQEDHSAPPERRVIVSPTDVRFAPYSKPTNRPATSMDSRRTAVCDRPQPAATVPIPRRPAATSTAPRRPAAISQPHRPAANSPPRFHPHARPTTPFPYHGDGGRLTPPQLIPLQPQWERDYDDVFEPAPSTYAPQGYQLPSHRRRPEEAEEQEQMQEEQEQMQEQWDHQHHKQQQMQERENIAHQVDTQLRLLRDQTNVGPSVRVTIPPTYPGGNHS